jgi:transposase
VCEGKPHEYLPDFVGTLCDGGLLIAEAGRESEKSQGRALVKAEAARRLAHIKGGVYWIGTDGNLSERRHQNWLYLHAPGRSPILPDPLPSELEETGWVESASSHGSDEDLALHPHVGIPGPTFDASVLATAEEQVRFHRNLAAVTAVLAGMRVSGVARAHGMATSTLSRLVRRTKELGQIACVPHATYHRDRLVHPELQQLIRKLYTQPLHPTVTAVCEDVQLKHLAEELSQREGKPISVPSYHQVRDFAQVIAQETAVADARSGLKHPPRERMSSTSFVLSIASPALICQVDEHTLDLLVLTPDGTVITRRVHGAVLICVKTAAILAAVVSLDSLKEEDYMRLVKMAIEPKDRITALYACHHPWPCSGKPAVIFHDRGKIFTSERATQVLVDRLGITTEQAPPYAPTANGTVEALFTWTTRKLEHRLPGTTKSSAADRGTYDSHREAEKGGITLDVLEKLFIQAIVDGYMQEWDKLRRAKRVTLWEDSVREKGLPRFMGAPDDLKLLLMKAVNRKNPATGRYAITHGSLSFLGRRYVSPGLLDRLRGREIEIYYDRRDISVIYLFVEGSYVGEAYCTELMGRRTSVWEAQAQNKAQAEQVRAATQESLAARQRIVASAQPHKKRTRTEAIRQEQSRQLARQREEIHPPHVLSKLAAMQPPPSRHLPKAEPDPESDRPVQKLAIRERGEEV